MSDTVEKLRRSAALRTVNPFILTDAADEIDRLRAKRDALEAEATELRTDNEGLAADVMRLRARVEELEERIVDMSLRTGQEEDANG